MKGDNERAVRRVTVGLRQVSVILVAKSDFSCLVPKEVELHTLILN